jgi:hypothetical protein
MNSLSPERIGPFFLQRRWHESEFEPVSSLICGMKRNQGGINGIKRLRSEVCATS